jgi:hypothetical protein
MIAAIHKVPDNPSSFQTSYRRVSERSGKRLPGNIFVTFPTDCRAKTPCAGSGFPPV